MYSINAYLYYFVFMLFHAIQICCLDKKEFYLLVMIWKARDSYFKQIRKREKRKQFVFVQIIQAYNKKQGDKKQEVVSRINQQNTRKTLYFQAFLINMKVFDKQPPLKERFYNALSNLFLLMFLKDNERNRTKTYYIFLVTFYFVQICGFMCTLSQKESTDTYAYYFFEFLQKARFLPIISSVSNGIIPVIILLIILVMEVYVIYCAYVLSLANIKDDCDVMKRQEKNISTLQLYLEHQKWIYCLPKFDLLFACYFCSSTNGPIISSRCGAVIQFSEQGFLYRGLILLLFFFVLITSITISLINILIYHNPEFNAVNQLKSRYSVLKSVEPFLEICLVMFSYFGSVFIVFIVAHTFGIFLMIEYFMHFPLVDKNISDIYGWLISVFEIFTTLFLIREYFDFFSDRNFVFVFLMLIALSYGLFKIIWNKKFILAMTVDPNRLGDFPQETCLYLEKLCELYEKNYTSLSQKLLLFGTLQLHKNFCKALLCPCKNEEINKLAGDEKPTLSGGMIIDCGRDIKIKGVDFSRVCQNELLFERWLQSFIDFQFEVLIAFLIKKGEQLVCQEVCLRYWFFLIKFKKNSIKALFQNKVMTTLIIHKNTFFATVERSLTNLIENRLKERDKAHSYSYRQKDRSDAANNVKFEKMVLTETKKNDLKKLVGSVMKEKVEFMNQLITGFTNYNIMQDSAIKLIKQVCRIENGLLQMVEENPDNIYFLKLLAMIKSFLIFDPLYTRKIESDLQDMFNKEKSSDATTITSLTILSGNVGSIIASFKTEKDAGKILQYSERIPQIFSYDRGEFVNKDRVKDLIPDCISILHDQFLQRLIQTGIAKTVRSYRTMFAKNKNGFIFLCKLFINYYFVKQDDFAFSALIIKIQTHSNYMILNEQGYIEDLTEGIVEIMNAKDIDISYFKQCHVSIYIPQFLDFIESYDPQEEYAFLKYRTDFPKDPINFTSQFINHHKNFHQRWDVDRDNWRKNLNQFIKNRKGNIFSYESILNIRVEEFEGIDRVVRLFIIEIEKMLPWDETNSLLSGSTRNTGKSRQGEFATKEIKGQTEEFLQQETFQAKNGHHKDKNNGTDYEEAPLNETFNPSSEHKSNKKQQSNPKNRAAEKIVQQQQIDKYNTLETFQKQNTVQNSKFNDIQVLKPLNEEDILHSAVLSEQGDAKPFPNEGSFVKEQFLENINQLTTVVDDSNALLNANREHYQDQFEKINDIIHNPLGTSQIKEQQQDQIVKEQFEVEANYAGISLQQNQANQQRDLENQQKQNASQNVAQQLVDYQSNLSQKSIKEGKQKQQATTEANVLNTSVAGYFGNSTEQQQNMQNSNQNEQKKQVDSSDDEDSKKQQIVSFDTDREKREQYDIKNQLITNQNNHVLQELNENQSQQTSINSQETSIIKKIVFSSEATKTPFFLIGLNTVFIFQFFVFIGVVIVLIVTISKNFQDYTGSMNEMGRCSKILTPVCQTLLTTDFLCLQNMNQMPVQSQDINKFMTDNVSDGFSDFISSYYNFLNEQISYNYQNTFYNYQITALIQANQNSYEQQMFFTEFLKKTTESIYQLMMTQIQQALTITNDQRQLLTNNINSMYQLLYQTQQEIAADLLNLKNSIIKVNVISVVLGTFLIALSFVFICSPYQMLKQNTERILAVISRMTEHEAETIVSGLTFMTTQLFSLNDDYLHIDFSNLALRDDQHLDGHQESKSKSKRDKSGSRKKNSNLTDRINDPKIKFNSFFYTLVLLCFMSTSFFVTVFVYMETFPSQFDPPSNRYQYFLQGSLEFSTMVSSHNILMINSLLATQGYQSISTLKVGELQSLRSNNFQQAQKFFSTQYDSLVNQQTSGSFQQDMLKINQGNACESSYFSEAQQALCSQTKNGLLQKGLQYSITSMLNQIQNEVYFENDPKYIQQMINQQDYTESLIVYQMIDHLLKSIIVLFENENVSIKNTFLTIFQLILILGCFVYVVTFFIVMVFFLSTIRSNYQYIKRGIQLIPFKRLCEDQMTLFLLKKVLEI
ncbi:transmembrane protein, putative (macronuclear) [Tetrahymena thermophila SB210]|uniref:Transmembrane protein, putative n=1 Tax=Tetrahymena thermophila (strain SB210) TaxID=312017 RepID=I7MIA9_TETTS|nr:transmembrane protein, putative [Tetrahymena thermophila SB210]EAS04238.2 transmembrane protein, putative [Tetrahymena thermophila SB210]|eukprot:XP_001024483.2 transmembrane protein, putative [Tetrahymena thermophila SB210]